MTVLPAPISTAVLTLRVVYLLLGAVLLASVLAQVFLAGTGALVDASYFALHQTAGHALGPLLLPMLVSAFFGHLPRTMT